MKVCISYVKNEPTYFLNHEKTIRNQPTTQDTFGFIEITGESFEKFEKFLKMPMWGASLILIHCVGVLVQNFDHIF